MPVLLLYKKKNMEQIVLKTNLSCDHCVMKVEPVLKGTKGIADYSINLQHPDKLVTISSEGADIDAIVAEFKKAGYIAQKI